MIDAFDLSAALEPFAKLDKDLKNAAKTLSPNEARFLVDSYYAIQAYRIRSGNQIRALSESAEPHELLRWMYGNTEGLEKNIQKALDAFSKNHPVGQWLRAVPGIGPVLASGLIAHIDITKAPYAGHIFSYAGLLPDVTWEKGQKRPWNADLKKICFLIGESFIKVQNNKRDLYGHVYAHRKQLEQEANELGMYAEQARATLQEKRYGKDTIAYQYYSQGQLPPAHIHARARRFAVKFFLQHVHHVWYEIEYGKEPPHPYIMEYLGHVSYIKPPFWPLSSKDEVAQEEEIVDLGMLDTANEDEVQEENVMVSTSAITAKPPTLAVKIARFKRVSQQIREKHAE